MSVTVDRAFAMRVPAGDPIVLQYRRLNADGTVRQLLGEVYSLAIYDRDRVTRAGGASAIQQDIEGDYAAIVVAAADVSALLGMVDLRWELAELLPEGGRDRRYDGLFTVDRSAGTLTGTPPVVGEGDAIQITEQDDSE